MTEADGIETNKRPSVKRPDRSSVVYVESDFVDLLSDEYKILQDKIDKIGNFRFTIKGWSITAVVAGTIGAGSKGFAVSASTSVGLILMLIFFLLFEYEQVLHSRLYGDRASRIEDAFRGLRLGRGEALFKSLPVPYIAHALVLAAIRKRVGKPKSKSRPSSAEDFRESRGLFRVMGKLHVTFYFALMLFSVITPVIQYFSITLQSRHGILNSHRWYLKAEIDATSKFFETMQEAE